MTTQAPSLTPVPDCPPQHPAPFCLPAPFFPSAALLDRILDLLLGFVQRTHQALAAVGVAAMVRLIVAAGPNLDEPTWMMVRKEGGLGDGGGREEAWVVSKRQAGMQACQLNLSAAAHQCQLYVLLRPCPL